MALTKGSASQVTILRPREPNFTPSSRLTTDFLIELEANIDRQKWANRKEFIFQTLAFCLSLPNLWRFPREAFVGGQAAFVWIYIFFMICVGSSLFFFEVALGQYSSKGFAKVFAMCPLFEGISYSMAIYCALVSTYYNVLNSYSFVYIFASFNSPNLKYRNCHDMPKNVCVEGSANQNLTPEFAFFHHRVLYYSTSNYDRTDTWTKTNWRAIGVLFFLWVVVCIAIVRGIRISKWPAMIYCPMPYIILTITLSCALTIEGSNEGLKAMFYTKLSNFLHFTIWRRAFEQTILALSIGMGPLITLGSYSKFQSPADRDSLVLCSLICLGSLLSGSVFFCSLGALAYERNQTMATVLLQNGTYSEDFSAYVIFSHVFTRIKPGFSHTVAWLFFFLFLVGGWYSLITYTETFIVSCYNFFPCAAKHKLYTNFGICFVCFFFGSLFASRMGYITMLHVDKALAAIGLMVILFCELCAVAYIYGLHDFCDDIDFMLGFFPNLYCQTVWLCTPLVVLAFLGSFIWVNDYSPHPDEKTYTVAATASVILAPIIIQGVYNTLIAYKNGFLEHKECIVSS